MRAPAPRPEAQDKIEDEKGKGPGSHRRPRTEAGPIRKVDLLGGTGGVGAHAREAVLKRGEELEVRERAMQGVRGAAEGTLRQKSKHSAGSEGIEDGKETADNPETLRDRWLVKIWQAKRQGFEYRDKGKNELLIVFIFGLSKLINAIYLLMWEAMSKKRLVHAAL